MVTEAVVILVLISVLSSLIAAPMGCLVMWHRLAFLADTIAHASILGIAIAMIMSVHPMFGVAAISLIVIFIIIQTQYQQQLVSESVLAIISQVGLALGILLLASTSQYDGHVHVEDLLFGDIGHVDLDHLIILGVVSLFIVSVLALNWKKLLLISMSWEISQAEGLSVQKNRLIIYLLMSLMIAMLMNVMGVLLIASLLIIPPTAVRWFSVSPEKMVLFSFIFALLSMLSGLWLADVWGLISGPMIVLTATFGLIFSQFFKKLQDKH